MAWPEQPDVVAPAAREAVARMLLLFADLNPDNAPERQQELDEALVAFRLYGANIIPALAEVLDHPEPVGQAMVALSLIHLSQASPGLVRQSDADKAASAIVNAISAKNLDHRFAIMLAMGSQGCVPPQAVPALRAMLNHPDTRLQVGAAAALCHARPGADGEESQSGEDWGALLRTLRTALRSKDSRLVMAAASALARMGVQEEAAVDALASAIANADAAARCSILRAASRVSSPTSALREAISGVLRNGSAEPVDRQAAALALTRLAPDAAEAAAWLRRAFEAGDENVVVGGLEAMIELPDVPADAVSIITACLDSEDAELRSRAAGWLGINRSAAEKAVPALVERIGKETDESVLEYIFGALTRAGRAAVPPLVEIVRTGDMTRSVTAMSALVAVGSEAVGEVTRVLLMDESERVRKTGLLVLREMGAGAGTAGPVVLDLLAKTEGEHRKYIVLALTMVAPEFDAAIPVLLEELRSDDPEVAYLAGQGLVKAGQAAVPALEAARESAPAKVRGRIEEILNRTVLTGAPLDRLEAFGNDNLLELFAWVGHVMEKHGRLSERRVSDILRGKDSAIKNVHSKISKLVPQSHAGFRKAIEKLEKKLNGGRPLTNRDRAKRKSGGLTEDGRKLLREVQQYLQRKGRWNAETA